MILWTSKAITEAEPAIERLGRRSWRWTVFVERWVAGAEQQVLFRGGGWRSANRYVRAWVDGMWRIGMDHGYYDGPHCQLSIGWLHVGWSLWYCERCMPKEAK